MAAPIQIPIDFSSKAEIPRSNPDCGTRLYRVKLHDDWSPEVCHAESPGAVLSSTLAKGQTVVMKVFWSGPEKEKKQEAERRCDSEYRNLNRFNEEAAKQDLQALAWYEKVNIVTVFGQGLDDLSHPFILMEQGECSLGELLHHRKKDCPAQAESNKSLPAESQETPNAYTMNHCFTYLCQIFSAVSFLHSHGIMHRDLKSYNVLLFNNKTLAKLIDFEDCKQRVVGAPSSMTPKMGTTWWRAPELFLTDPTGQSQYGLAADWFSFGLVMCEALFREEPFECYYTGILMERSVEPSRVYADRSLSCLPRRDEIERGCAMYIDNLTVPGSPQVVLDTEKCVFKSAVVQNVWSLISGFLNWDPKQRPSGKNLKDQFDQIISYGTGSPDELRFTIGEEPTDTGARATETVISWKAGPSCRRVIRLLARSPSGLDLTEPEDLKDLRNRLQEHGQDVFTLASMEPTRTSHIRFDVKSKKLAMSISGFSDAFVNDLYDFCSTSQDFLDWLTGLFKYHENVRLRNAVFKVERKEDIANQLSQAKLG